MLNSGQEAPPPNEGGGPVLQNILNMDRLPSVPLLPRTSRSPVLLPRRTPDGGRQFFDAFRSPLS
jgi:hypothetical protein